MPTLFCLCASKERLLLTSFTLKDQFVAWQSESKTYTADLIISSPHPFVYSNTTSLPLLPEMYYTQRRRKQIVNIALSLFACIFANKFSVSFKRAQVPSLRFLEIISWSRECQTSLGPCSMASKILLCYISQYVPEHEAWLLALLHHHPLTSEGLLSCPGLSSWLPMPGTSSPPKYTKPSLPYSSRGTWVKMALALRHCPEHGSKQIQLQLLQSLYPLPPAHPLLSWFPLSNLWL